MKLCKLKLKNYRCFEDIIIDFHENLTVIVGSNGSGKTSVLEGAAISLGTFFLGLSGLAGVNIQKRDAHLIAYPMGESFDVQAQYPVEIVAEGIIEDRQISWKRSLNGKNGSTTIKEAKELIEITKKLQERLREGNKNVILPLMAYYGTGRLLHGYKNKKLDTFPENTKINGYINSLDGTANVNLMMNWFRKKTIQKIQKSELGIFSENELAMVYQAMGACFSRITGYEDVKFLFNLDTNEIDCYYRDKNGLVVSIPLPQMSDGYKGTINLIADIAYRMTVLNPQLGKSILEETDGVVLIDEIDLHLHPAWQHRILSDLREIFPKIQFIVTTHAPAVISSVKSENLVILKENEPLPATAEIYGNDVNSILKNIMGVSERNPAVAKLFERFYELLGNRRYDEAEEILDIIDEARGWHDKEVAADRVKLKLERIRGGSK